MALPAGAAVPVFSYRPLTWNAARPMILIFLSAIFLRWSLESNVLFLGTMAYLVLALALIKLQMERTFVILILGVFLYFRSIHFYSLGLSFLSLRLFEVLFHFRENPPDKLLLKEEIVLAFLYCIYFPGFFYGPLERFGIFCRCFTTNNAFARKEGQFFLILRRSSIGLLKILFLGKLFYQNSVLISPVPWMSLPFYQIWLSSWCTFFYIYFNFSGYTDCAIALSNLLGVSLPENFDHPLLSSNLKDFWNRWHRSVSSWFRDRVFFPICGWLQTSSIPVSPSVAISLSMLFTFSLIGIWHGPGWRWILYGLCQGAGLVFLTFFKQFMKSRFPRLKISKTLPYRVFSTFISLQYVAFTMLLLGKML